MNETVGVSRVFASLRFVSNRHRILHSKHIKYCSYIRTTNNKFADVCKESFVKLELEWNQAIANEV